MLCLFTCPIPTKFSRVDQKCVHRLSIPFSLFNICVCLQQTTSYYLWSFTNCARSALSLHRRCMELHDRDIQKNLNDSAVVIFMLYRVWISFETCSISRSVSSGLNRLYASSFLVLNMSSHIGLAKLFSSSFGGWRKTARKKLFSELICEQSCWTSKEPRYFRF